MGSLKQVSHRHVRYSIQATGALMINCIHWWGTLQNSWWYLKHHGHHCQVVWLWVKISVNQRESVHRWKRSQYIPIHRYFSQKTSKVHLVAHSERRGFTFRNVGDGDGIDINSSNNNELDAFTAPRELSRVENTEIPGTMDVASKMASHYPNAKGRLSNMFHW